MDPESIELFLAYCIKIYLGVWISKLHFCLPSTPCMFYCSVDSSFSWIANCPCTPVSIGRQCLSNCIFEGRIVFISRHLKKMKNKNPPFYGRDEKRCGSLRYKSSQNRKKDEHEEWRNCFHGFKYMDNWFFVKKNIIEKWKQLSWIDYHDSLGGKRMK